jgi:hypothetical protein
MKVRRRWFGGVLLACLASCGGGGGASVGSIDDAQDFELVMGLIAIPLADVLTDLGTSTTTLASSDETLEANPTTCPGGGTAGFDMAASTGTFAGCNLGGVGVSGTLGVVFVPGTAPDFAVNLGTGTLTFSGAASGSVQILGGQLQWRDPATDDNTYWLARAIVGSAEVCAWSGGGACPGN